MPSKPELQTVLKDKYGINKNISQWFECDHYILTKYPERYGDIQFARPSLLLKSLRAKQ